MYYDSRATGVAMQPVTADKPAWLLAHQLERQMPEFREFYAIYDAVGIAQWLPALGSTGAKGRLSTKSRW